MPALVGVVINSPDAPREVKGLCVGIGIGGWVVMVVATVLDKPHTPVVVEGDPREGDKIHGLGFFCTVIGLRRLQQDYLQEAGGGEHIIV